MDLSGGCGGMVIAWRGGVVQALVQNIILHSFCLQILPCDCTGKYYSYSLCSLVF